MVNVFTCRMHLLLLVMHLSSALISVVSPSIATVSQNWTSLRVSPSNDGDELFLTRSYMYSHLVGPHFTCSSPPAVSSGYVTATVVVVNETAFMDVSALLPGEYWLCHRERIVESTLAVVTTTLVNTTEVTTTDINTTQMTTTEMNTTQMTTTEMNTTQFSFNFLDTANTTLSVLISGAVDASQSKLSCCGVFTAGELANCSITAKDVRGFLSGTSIDECKFRIAPLLDGQSNPIAEVTAVTFIQLGMFNFTFRPIRSGCGGRVGTRYREDSVGDRDIFFHVKAREAVSGNEEAVCGVVDSNTTQCTITQRDVFNNTVKRCTLNATGTMSCQQL